MIFIYAWRVETVQSLKRREDNTHGFFLVSELVMLTIQKAGRMFRLPIE